MPQIFPVSRYKRPWLARLFPLGLLIVSGQSFAEPAKCYPPRHADLPTILGEAYPQARWSLLRAGWQPDFSVARSPAMTPADYSAAEKWAVESGYFELESCAGTGRGACLFVFGDAYGNRLRVTTEGEMDSTASSYPLVSSYRLVCE